MMLDIKRKKITIIGAKRSACALAHLALSVHGCVKVSDCGFDEGFDIWAQEQGIDYEHSGHTKQFVEDSDLIVLSPGVSIHSDVVAWARQKNMPVLGEIEFAIQFCETPVIAVTGSNGKTTVATLIHEVLQKAGVKGYLCGNIGTPLAQFCLNADKNQYFILEVSSFQLESMLTLDSVFRKKSQNGRLSFKGFKPFIAVWLNFSQNHLDRHKDLKEYFDAKTKLFLNQDHDDHAVLTSHCQEIKKWSKQCNAQISFFDSKKSMGNDRFNNPNQSAVLEVARILNIDAEICHQVFKEFQGVEHRLEWVRTIEGVDFFNDSKATTAEASRWALNWLKQPVVLICGGKDKNIDFSVLKKIVEEKVKTMIVFGEAKEKLKNTFEGTVKVQLCEDLDDAVKRAQEYAKDGDCVLLSPMCASFDMFSNFEERGNVFKRIVQHL